MAAATALYAGLADHHLTQAGNGLAGDNLARQQPRSRGPMIASWILE